MNTETLTRQAIRAAQRKSLKAGRVLTREEVLRLEVQTFSSWKRGVFVVSGALAEIFALFCYSNEAPWPVWLAFLLGGSALILFGLFGRKAYLERELDKLIKEAPGTVADSVVNAVIDGL